MKTCISFILGAIVGGGIVGVLYLKKALDVANEIDIYLEEVNNGRSRNA